MQSQVENGVLYFDTDGNGLQSFNPANAPEEVPHPSELVELTPMYNPGEYHYYAVFEVCGREVTVYDQPTE